MTRSTLRGLCLAGLISLCGGCSAPLTRFEAALEGAGVARFSAPATARSAVEVRASLEAGALAGRGAVVSDRHVLTVAHVLQGRAQVFVATGRDGGWVAARVVRRQVGDPEPLVLLELEVDEGAFGLLLGFDGFAGEQVLAAGDGAPTSVLTARGLQPWTPGVLLPGDSGSPVLDATGALVGLVSGRRGEVGVYVRTRTPTQPATPVVLAAAR